MQCRNKARGSDQYLIFGSVPPCHILIFIFCVRCWLGWKNHLLTALLLMPQYIPVFKATITYPRNLLVDLDVEVPIKHYMSF
jgi:hypothetical protein